MSESDRYPYTGNIPARKFLHPPERVKNQFANDGSFLETFKKKQMEKEEQMKNANNNPDAQISTDNLNSNTKKNNTTTTSTSNDQLLLSSSSDNLSILNNSTRPPNSTTAIIITPQQPTNPLKSGLLPLVGKRRSDLRRSLKTGIVKKLRTDTSDTADKSLMNASSKYTEEVKRYKATMCVEDEKSRPLVK